MSNLELRFLGGFQVVLNGNPAPRFKSNKVRALLAYLAVEADRPHRREALAGLLWPDRPDRDALSNLRYSLASLRRTLGDPSAAFPCLSIQDSTIQFTCANAWIDVAHLEAKIGASTQPGFAGADHARSASHILTPELRDRLAGGIALYRGAFLDGFSVEDAAPFEEWVSLRREQFTRWVAEALGLLAADGEARGEFERAQTFAWQQVQLEPWNEEAHQALMRALALDGRRAAALHQYQECCRMLSDDLGVGPSEETAALFTAIRDGTLVAPGAGIPAAVHGAGSQRPTGQAGFVTASSLVGREDQLAELDALLAEALAGTGGAVFVTGEAGSGKSMLLAEFARRALSAHPGLLVAGSGCDAVTGIGDPYLPFRTIVQLLAGDIEHGRSGALLSEEAVRRLWATMPDALDSLLKHGPGLLDIFVPAADVRLRMASAGRPFRAGSAAPAGGEDRRAADEARQGVAHAVHQLDLFDQVTGVLLALARQHPLLLVIDDLQWADPGTIGLLFHLGRRLGASRILLAGAYRPDAVAASSGASHHPLLVVVNELQRITGRSPIDLDACDGRAFVAALLHTVSHRLPSDFGEAVFRHTEGHPLFTVELLRTLTERGDLVRDDGGRWTERTALYWDDLPARAEAIIAERIGRLPEQCRIMLAAASVEGQEFLAETLAVALEMDERAVIRCLSGELGERHHLVDAMSLRRLGTRRLARYRFRHHLFRKYLYDHLDPVRRGDLHEAAGRALEALYGAEPDELDALAPRLAWHFESAGLPDQAARYHLQAANRASRVAAYDEAIAHLRQVLALIAPLATTPDRYWLELEAHLAILSPLTYAHGFWSPERVESLERAFVLADNPALAAHPRLWTVALANAYYALWSAEPTRALEISTRAISQSAQVPAQAQWANCLTGCAHLMRGDAHSAMEYLDRAIDCPAPACDPQRDLLVGIEASIMALTWRALAQWHMGFPDQARRMLQAALAAAERSVYSVTLAHVQSMASLLYFLYGRDPSAAGEQVQKMRQAVTVLPFEALAASLLDPEAPAGSRGDQFLEQMRQGLDHFQAVGSGLGRAGLLLLLARGYGQAGQIGAGLATLDEALDWMSATGVRIAEAEAIRLRGELLLISARHDPCAIAAAETAFRHAIDVARQQNARWWELRATVSLCRLIARHGQLGDGGTAEARRLLIAIASWFSEGFDTPDMQDARALLQEIGVA